MDVEEEELDGVAVADVVVVSLGVLGSDWDVVGLDALVLVLVLVLCVEEVGTADPGLMVVEGDVFEVEGTREGAKTTSA